MKKTLREAIKSLIEQMKMQKLELESDIQRFIKAGDLGGAITRQGRLDQLVDDLDELETVYLKHT